MLLLALILPIDAAIDALDEEPRLAPGMDAIYAAIDALDEEPHAIDAAINALDEEPPLALDEEPRFAPAPASKKNGSMWSRFMHKCKALYCQRQKGNRQIIPFQIICRRRPVSLCAFF